MGLTFKKIIILTLSILANFPDEQAETQVPLSEKAEQASEQSSDVLPGLHMHIPRMQIPLKEQKFLQF